MKKLFSLISVFILALCLTACIHNGNNGNNNSPTNNPGTTPNPPVVEFPSSGIDTTHFELIDKLEIPILKSKLIQVSAYFNAIFCKQMDVYPFSQKAFNLFKRFSFTYTHKFTKTKLKKTECQIVA